MPKNKLAYIRYHELDKCFSSRAKLFDIEGLVEACNEAIFENNGSEGVKKRQVYDDIRFMESESGWSIELERQKRGRKVYYKYTDPSFSIRGKSLTPQEASSIKETLDILSRFKGVGSFEWVGETRIRLQKLFPDKSEDISSVVQFDQNPYLIGLEFLDILISSTLERTVLNIEYQSFKHEKPISLVMSPWLLKQFNNRWFLFGFNHETARMVNLGLDRLIKVSPSTKNFVTDSGIYWEEYFEDVVGVTVLDNIPVDRVILKVSNTLWPYIKSKPIHGSQKVLEEKQSYTLLELHIKFNYEFKSLILSHMSQIEILEPTALRDTIGEEVKKLFYNYF
ncbi:helix-turn-helix transcriptional regulator [Phaeocystidibacter luteus]|uniref:WYL domain-containing protein n=1 Tax=Phaeocystidibacter luteus TaxID=911197 RepID=A0A6N6RFR6_9FLAO|nr:WYL domain-containing protein [Phaeocystidibacter luteus]KAB2810001.1 WYL domain-containing protein [Phaeocystidibacter luteus]